jgi:hydroxymethylglutaryl-CoA synthase
VHQLLKLSTRCRVIELKQACYSATFALQTAMSFIQTGKAKKVLIISADVARYGLGSSGESSQGAAAIALLISVNPRLLVIEPESSFLTEDVMDFFRPNYKTEAIVDGHYSCSLYLSMLKKVWTDYQNRYHRDFYDFSAFCLHIPVPRLVEKGYKVLAPSLSFGSELEDLLYYSRLIGNCYSASLFLGLCSLLECSDLDFSNKRIGFYSYGSGCSAEFFSGIAQPDYQQRLYKNQHRQLLTDREELSLKDYEDYYNVEYPCDGRDYEVPLAHVGLFRLARFSQHQRYYEAVAQKINQHHFLNALVVG